MLHVEERERVTRRLHAISTLPAGAETQLAVPSDGHGRVEFGRREEST